LKSAVLGAAGVTAAAGGGTAVVATAVVALCVAGGGTAAVDIARENEGERPAQRERRPARVVPAAAAPAGVTVTRQAGPKTSSSATPGDPDRPGRHKAKWRRGNRHRAAAVTPAVGVEAERTTPKGARPPNAKGPKPKAARPLQSQRSKPKSVKVRGPKPKAPKKPKPEKPPKLAKAPEPVEAADEPVGEPLPEDALPGTSGNANGNSG
jgi:hypothetical protein